MNITPQQLSEAAQAADNPVWIETPSALARAAKAWRRSPELAIDTEFVRERTYFAKLGLVQISDTQTVWLLDVPALNNLDPLAELFADQGIIKTMHGAGEDLEIFWQRLEVLPDPLFDTQVAAAMLGYPLQLAYEHMINELLPMQLDKGPSRSNWLKRPLSDAQILYAGNDVTYLPLAAAILRTRLEHHRRQEWHAQDMQGLLEQARRPTDENGLYLRVKGAGRLSGMGLAWLQKLAAWRDRQARQRDLPRGFVLNDPELVSIAALATRRHPVTEQDILGLDDLHPKARRRYAEPLLEVLKDQPAEPLPELPGRPDSAQRTQLAAMQALVRSIAGELQVEPTLLASKRVLQGLQSQPPEDELLQDWRGRLLNGKLRRLLNLD